MACRIVRSRRFTMPVKKGGGGGGGGGTSEACKALTSFCLRFVRDALGGPDRADCGRFAPGRLSSSVMTPRRSGNKVGRAVHAQGTGTVCAFIHLRPVCTCHLRIAVFAHARAHTSTLPWHTWRAECCVTFRASLTQAHRQPRQTRSSSVTRLAVHFCFEKRRSKLHAQ